MYFYLIGVDYQSAGIDTREALYRKRREIYNFWKPKEAGVLFTCNRIEIYGVSPDADIALSHLAEFSKNFPEFFRYSYVKYGEKEVFRHLLRLASGLESQIKGELQILWQLNNWRKDEGLPFLLSGLLERAISLAEAIRRQSGFDAATNNIAEVVYADLIKRLKPVRQQEVIVVGAGKIAELLVQYQKPEFRLNFMAHKHYGKAKRLAGLSGGRVFLLEDLRCVLPQASALISATTSPHYILKKEDFLGARNNFYIYDLALPRDIEPQAADLPGIFLQNLDDLTGAVYAKNN